MIRSRSAIAAGLLLGLPALAQEGASMLVPTVPGMFGIDTCGAFLCGNPSTVPHGSKRAIDALEAAFRPRAVRASGSTAPAGAFVQSGDATGSLAGIAHLGFPFWSGHRRPTPCNTFRTSPAGRAGGWTLAQGSSQVVAWIDGEPSQGE